MEHASQLGKRIKSSRPCRIVFTTVLILMPLVAALLCICIGRYSASPIYAARVIWENLIGAGDPQDVLTKVVWTMRLPRTVLALLVGGGLSAAGVAFQSLFANPLATPDTLGVASGASFGAVVALLFGANLLIVQGAALAAGFLAVALTLLVGSSKRGNSMTSMILGGMVVASLFSALISFVKLVADTDSKLPAITYWLMGSLSSANWNTLALGSPFIIVGIAMLFALRWRLNILPLSEDEARASGTRLGLLRLLTAMSGTMITAACVSLCGQVGWVGLLIPHICRMALGSDNMVLIPASISVGAVFMVVMDTAARSITAAELPVSILTALIGAPFFIVLLRRTGGWSL